MTKAEKRRQIQRIRRRRMQILLILCAAAVPLAFAACPRKEEPHEGNDSPQIAQSEPGSMEIVDGNWIQVSAPTGGTSLLTLVNGQFACDPSQAQDLVTLYEVMANCYSLRTTDLRISSVAVEPLNRWLTDFYAKSGLDTINIIAAYRTTEEQQALYDNAQINHGPEHAKQYLAHAGHSEHHTGLAVDLATWINGVSGDFTGSGEYAWVLENAWKYGFIQRYPPGKADITGINYESWHFRYVGLPHAKLIYEQGLCLEEYIALLEQHPFTGEHITASCEGKDYEIYCCDVEQIYVPTDAGYELSLTNTGSCVVTVQR